MCVRGGGRVVIHRIREASLSLLISLMQQEATAPAVTAGPVRPKVQEHQSPYLTLLSRLTNMWLCLSSVTSLPLDIHLSFCFIRT